MKLVPLGDKVIVKSIRAKEKTDSGIILSRAAREKPNEARVVAISKDIVSELEIGSVVFISKYAGTDVELDGVVYTIVRESDILAFVEE